MPRPATGKTPLRNLRSPDEVWLPALARAAAEGETVTDVINDRLREYGSTPPSHRFTFAEWPDARPWLDAQFPAWSAAAQALVDVTAGLVDQEYAGVALWLALTRHPADQAQQQRVMAGFLLGRANTVEDGGWRDRYADSRALLRAITEVLSEHLPNRPTLG
ncbi:MAG: hypothetical protein ACHP9Z_02160 [Streptosporangiales bacterium]